MDDTFALLHGATDAGYRINVAGELDIVTAQAVAEAVEAFQRSDQEVVVVDLAGVTFVDSAGSWFLTGLSTIAESRNGLAILVNVQPKVLRVLTLLGRVGGVGAFPEQRNDGRGP